MGKIHPALEGQYIDFLQDKMRSDAMFEAAHRDKNPIKYFNIIQKLWYNNKSDKYIM